MRLIPLSLLSLALVLPASAHHRQTPAVVALTTAGDAALPRLPPASRKAAAIVVDAGITVVSPFSTKLRTAVFTFQDGTNDNPTISASGRIVAWDSDADPLGTGAPGRQVVQQSRLILEQPVLDPTGTSANPALEVAGKYLAFESTGDLAGTGNAGARQIFLKRPDGALVQVSRGNGSSRNPAVGKRARAMAFDSTSHPVTGEDTGIAQIWIADLATGTTEPITSGLGDSTGPSLSSDGRLVVFESRADLAGDGSDTGVPQVFAYDTISRTFARITNEPGGCTAPAAARIKRDWRIAHVCGDTASFSMLRANTRHTVATEGGHTTRLIPQTDAHFMLVATTADLLLGGTTSGHRVYMVNLFTRPPAQGASSIVWFPSQGIPPL